MTRVPISEGPSAVYLARLCREGDEGALSHGSSVGLWIVEWGVDVLGGSVSFSTEGESGTTVTIRLPTARGP